MVGSFPCGTEDGHSDDVQRRGLLTVCSVQSHVGLTVIFSIQCGYEFLLFKGTLMSPENDKREAGNGAAVIWERFAHR